jgi:hypothetical protein
MILLAIDPGKKGALAWALEGIPPSVARIGVGPTAIFAQIDEILAGFPNAQRRVAFLEEVGGYIGVAQPASSAFRFGQSFGQVEGVLAALGFEIHRIRPQKWQKGLVGVGRQLKDKTQRKRRLRALAEELYPQLAKQITLQTADALLILDFGRKQVREEL